MSSATRHVHHWISSETCDLEKGHLESIEGGCRAFTIDWLCPVTNYGHNSNGYLKRDNFQVWTFGFLWKTTTPIVLARHVIFSSCDSFENSCDFYKEPHWNIWRRIFREESPDKKIEWIMIVMVAAIPI